MYRLLVAPALRLGLRLLALRSEKGRRIVEGRRRWRVDLPAPSPDEPATFHLHLHAASVGEYEQLAPLLGRARERIAALRATATFFSSSGFGQKGTDPLLDAAGILPDDRPAEMDELFQRLRPDLVLVARYDLWPEMMASAARQDVPVVLVSAVLGRSSGRFRFPIRGLFRASYERLRLACSVTEEDAMALRELAPELEVEVCGDTRYDRVVARVAGVRPNDRLRPDVEGIVVAVAGSTWPPDEIHLAEAAVAIHELRLVIVPHEPTEEHVLALQQLFPGARRYSDCTAEEPWRGEGHLIVDAVGLLAELYAVGEIAYVGGGFGAGVHSLLEPAAHSRPIITGPRIERSRDATALVRAGIASVASTAVELTSQLTTLARDREVRRRRGGEASAFVASRAGAIDRTWRALLERRLLPSSAAITDNDDRS